MIEELTYRELESVGTALWHYSEYLGVIRKNAGLEEPGPVQKRIDVILDKFVKFRSDRDEGCCNND